jgi:hypothetical protein
MARETEIEGGDKPQRPPAEVCTASVRLPALLSAATIAAVAVVVLLVWLLL